MKVARRRFPSDEARVKMRPHIRVHLTVASHRKTAAVWADLELRAMLVELWRISGEVFASKTEDVVCLSPGALRSVTGRDTHRAGLAALRRLCVAMSYTMREEGRATFVTVRNFSKKQRFDSADCGVLGGVTPQTPRPPKSEDRRPKTEDVEEPPSAPPARSARATSRRSPPPADLEPSEHEALRAWCREKLSRPDLVPRLPALVEACLTFHRGKGNLAASWYATAQTWVRNEAEGRFGTARTTRGNAPPPQGSRAERRARAQQLYSVDQLLPEPTEEALDRWQAAGEPNERAWWLPPEDRTRLRVVS